MKATLDIPDDLYRKVKAKAALAGSPIRTVAIDLFSEWLDKPESELTSDSTPAAPAPKSQLASFGIAKAYAAKVATHDMASIRESIAKGRFGQ